MQSCRVHLGEMVDLKIKASFSIDHLSSLIKYHRIKIILIILIIFEIQVVKDTGGNIEIIKIECISQSYQIAH